MGIFEKLSGRKDTTTDPVAGTTQAGDHKNEEAGQSSTGSDSDSLDLVDQNEKAINENPDEITANALPGVQKAEAAALVWSKNTVYLLYGW